MSRERDFPLPHVDPPWGSASRSRRCVARARRRARIHDVATTCTLALNHLHSNLTSFIPPPQANLPSKSQQRLLAHIDRCAERFVGRPSSDASGDEFYFDNSVDYFDLNQSGISACGYSVSTSSAPVALDAERVALPDVAGAVDWLGMLPPDDAAFYSDPARCLRPLSELPTLKQPPRARVFATAPQYVALLRRMFSIGMLDVLGVTQVRAVNGLFGVPKPDGTIRLIIDARPANRLFVDPPHISLPTPDILGRLRVPAGKRLWVAKTDLSDFFYRFRIPEWMRPYFALPPVKAGAIGFGHIYGENTLVYPCLAVLAMGWSHSVYGTQKSHLHLLDSNPHLQMQPADRLSKHDVDLDRMRHFVYVDDVCWFGTDPFEIGRSQRGYVDLANARDLPVKTKKIVHPSTDGVESLGIMVCGNDFSVGLSVPKLHRLCADTNALIARGHCTGAELARVVGRWTWAMLVTRPALAVWNKVYRYIETAAWRMFELWPTVIHELHTAIGIAPLLHTCVSAHFFDRVVATDASESGEGVCAARIHERDIMIASTHANNIQMRDAAVEATIDERLVTTARWMTIVAAPWYHEEHINRLELRAVSTAIRWVLSFPSSLQCRLLLLSDSQVAVGALSKGRSSSYGLLRCLRPISARVLASGLQLYVRYIPTSLNPADGPSRRWEC